MTTLRLIEVALGYEGRSVLRQVSLEVRGGEVLALVGPNGVGKSTLINAACGLLPVLAGQVLVDGDDLSRMSPPERARLVAVVPQGTSLPPAFTAFDVVLSGRTPYLGWLDRVGKADEQASLMAMVRTGTFDLARRRVGELSGGERQRVLIARALAQSAPVLLLDEPTAHLDLRHQDNVLSMVRALAVERGLAVMMSLHDLNLVARFADRVVLLSNGGVRSIGLPQHVLTPDELASVYGVKMLVLAHPVHHWPVVLPG